MEGKINYDSYVAWTVVPQCVCDHDVTWLFFCSYVREINYIIECLKSER